MLATKFGWNVGRRTAKRVPPITRSRRSRPRSSASAPTTWTSTTTTGPTASRRSRRRSARSTSSYGEGKARFAGCSNLTAEQLREVTAITEREGLTRDRRAPERVQPAPAVGRGGRCCRSAASTGSASCRTSRSPAASSPGSTGAARRAAPGKPSRGPPGAPDRRDASTQSRRSSGSRTSAGHTLLELAIGALASTPGVASVIAGATTAGAGARECARPRLAALGARSRRASTAFSQAPRDADEIAHDKLAISSSNQPTTCGCPDPCGHWVSVNSRGGIAIPRQRCTFCPGRRADGGWGNVIRGKGSSPLAANRHGERRRLDV